MLFAPAIRLTYVKKIGIIKDISAGAVILATLLSIIVGVLVYRKYFFY